MTSSRTAMHFFIAIRIRVKDVAASRLVYSSISSSRIKLISVALGGANTEYLSSVEVSIDTVLKSSNYTSVMNNFIFLQRI
jgi:hypothetical protein